MLTAIEQVVIKDLKGLCRSCRHATDCIYRKNSTRLIIQCEVFESADDVAEHKRNDLNDLCSNCSKERFCHLPKGPSGVWHCEEYE